MATVILIQTGGQTFDGKKLCSGWNPCTHILRTFEFEVVGDGDPVLHITRISK